MQETQAEHSHKFSFGMFLVALGIVYGDIGTSPMYVMKSIVEGNGGIANVDTEFIVGSLSLVIWTITLLTTIKHVLIALRADNHGEGGIFALYSLIRDCGKWLIIPTMIGGCTMLADGVLTPAVTVTTAVEGLRSIEVVNSMLGSGQHLVVVITLAIISALFMGSDHAGDHQRFVYDPAKRDQFHWQNVRAGHDAVVFVSGTDGGLADPWRSYDFAGPESLLCHRCSDQPQQQSRVSDPGKRIPVYHRCGGPVYGYGACGPEQHLLQLAFC